MADWLGRYAKWLHLRWPAGLVEPLPEVRPDGSTAVPGLYIAGDLTGVPLLKFALDSGARVARTVAADPALRRDGVAGRLDLVILGAGVAGMAAAVEAKARGLAFELIETREPFATIENFPRRKPIFTYPMEMRPEGALQVGATVKEALLEELRGQVAAHGIAPREGRAERVERSGDRLVVHLTGGGRIEARRVLVAIGRSGDFRRLGVPGDDLEVVSNRLHDPRDHAGQRVLVVGGGDSAAEAAIALAEAGAVVTLSHRGEVLDRPKPENVARVQALASDTPVAGRVRVLADSAVRAVRPTEVVVGSRAGEETLPVDAVYALIGREAPLAFFRRSRVPIVGEMTPGRWAVMALFLAFCTWMYDWKSGGFFTALWYRERWFPVNLPDLLAGAGGALAAAAADPASVLGTLAISASGPAFWVTLVYSAVVTGFGIARIRRRRTPYITAQTLTLMAVQVVPLFLVPELLLPLLEHRGALPTAFADALFPAVDYGHGREFWRAYGLILAWPLNIYNIITHEPLWWWIGIGALQTGVLIPLGIRFFGKGFYCGWICSCGALAETLGDTHRHKMPHGPQWNRLNLAGQVILAIAALMLVLRVVGWAVPGEDAIDRLLDPVLKTPYKWVVDVGLAGILGYGVYFWYSGRAWCRFFCPLAALMHIYARFSRFAIVPEKKKCISCNQCTSVCHMGIDVMSFANKGLPMQDPECVRCSACVHACPTGVLQFGQVDAKGGLISVDALLASPVRRREG
jgi:thioredoxin reductase/NAD-dependent dihydropyrimidine dehydrogenase PreA subunit